MTVDLGDMYVITGATIWHDYGSGVAHCNQGLSISETGAFSGEESSVYSTGSDFGPPEMLSGNSIAFDDRIGRFVRHW